MLDSIRVSDDRAAVVIADIEEGSHPHWRFFALLMIASMIACFGLVANSSAVIIGAMLVSPLMTPIFGVALGLLRGSPELASKAATAELLGIVLAIGWPTSSVSFTSWARKPRPRCSPEQVPI